MNERTSLLRNADAPVVTQQRQGNTLLPPANVGMAPRTPSPIAAIFATSPSADVEEGEVAPSDSDQSRAADKVGDSAPTPVVTIKPEVSAGVAKTEPTISVLPPPGPEAVSPNEPRAEDESSQSGSRKRELEGSNDEEEEGAAARKSARVSDDADPSSS